MRFRKTLPILGAVVALVLPSCIAIDSGPPYSSYGSTSLPPSHHRAHSSFGVFGPSIHGRSYGRGHHAPYRHAHGHKEERIKLIGGSQKGKGTRPKEYHTREWFEKKGYDLSNYKHKREHSGCVHTGRNYGKKSSSKSSGKKKKKKK